MILLKAIFLVACPVLSLLAATNYSWGNLQRLNALSRARGIAEVIALCRQSHSVEFSESLAENVSDASVRMYSSTSGSQERFILRSLSDKRVGEVVICSSRSLKLSVPDLVTASRLERFSSLAEKEDWQVGDVRGVIEVEVDF